ncbi:Rv3235 family protein [Umezawaea sp. Da 62-37]|uniref:Rv3235 family protein n=1 Tax=Umezawaea sp. Da 62-37 TaxID=3075927 RepID=UPI0028F6C9C5|nr:Rv3235 family protein [Umezawaea sp. Da 62-37]WNV90581.1 Rv3235 family protein [Umezawaea sp. Da 62-37]
MRVAPERVVALSKEEARRLMVVVLEGVDGLRSLGQLAGVVSGEVLRGLSVEVGRTRLGRLRICRVGAEAVEIAGTVIRGGRVRALAARVEFSGGGWRCVVFRVLG